VGPDERREQRGSGLRDRPLVALERRGASLERLVKGMLTYVCQPGPRFRRANLASGLTRYKWLRGLVQDSGAESPGMRAVGFELDACAPRLRLRLARVGAGWVGLAAEGVPL